METQNSNTEDTGIVFDTTSGIPESEQRDILAGIENLTAENRLSLSEDQKKSLLRGRIQAKKRGIAFPLIVNIAALLLLAGAVFLLYFFHDKDEVQIREGRAVYNSTERALIQEIRRETARELEEKENEIALIVSKLTGVDAELQELYSNNQDLTEEQRAVELNLQQLQEEYRHSLGALQNERSQILEASRAREAQLRAQLEERTRELALVSEQSSAALSAARSELDRLSSDTERAAAIEAQIGAYYAAAAVQIRGGNYSAAAGLLGIMREFLNTPAFHSIRSIQAWKDLYLTSINTLEGMITEAEKNAAAINALEAGSAVLMDKGDLAELEQTVADLQTQNSGLEENIAGLNRTLSANTTQVSTLTRQVGESQTRISTLQNQVTTQQRTLTERESTITNLQSQNDNLTRTVTARDSTITEQAASIEALNSRLTNIQQALQSLTE
ncbi:hypothetical protein FACS189476_09680 [Spirochaetia bacterium]|nr:hypothetical protein FACS189476_09680 [Spirochaetia bacterium]